MQPPITIRFPDNMWGPIKPSNEFSPGCQYRIPFATPLLTIFETGSSLSQSFAGDDYWIELWSISAKECGFVNIVFNEALAFMILVLKNHLSIELQHNGPIYSPERSYDIFYLPAGVQKMRLQSGNCVFLIIVPPVYYLQTIAAERTGMNDVLQRLTFHGEKGHHLVNFHLPNEALRIVKNLEKTDKKDIALDLELRLYILELVGLYYDQLKQHSIKKMLPATTSEKAIAVRNFILQNLTDSHLGGVHELASRFYISPKSLTKGFKTLTGKTIPQFISDERLSRARSLLEKKEMRIFEIATQTGFSETTNFIRKFKQKYGYSPGKEAARNKHIKRRNEG